MMHVQCIHMKLPRHTVEITLAGIIILCLAWFFRQFKRNSAPSANASAPSVDVETVKRATPVIDVPAQVTRHENPVTASDMNHAVETGGLYQSR